MAAESGQLRREVMEEVWKRSAATVAEVHGALAAKRRIAYTTVLTAMQALEQRGVLTHEKEGKAYRYTPLVSRHQYTKGRVGKLIEELFGGKPEALLSHLLGRDKISRAELENIRRMLGGSNVGGSQREDKK